jgi:ribonuclease G
MSKEILVHILEGERRVAVIENGRLDDFYLEVDRHQSILGNIYKGRVESILPSINGAFVNIGQERNGFLYLTDVINPLLEEEISGPRHFLEKIFKNPKNPEKKEKEQKSQELKQGQEILVQVVKEPFGTKGARLTTHLTLAGRYVVYMPFDTHFGVSKKIEKKEERQRLKEVLREFQFVKTGGFIVRTASLKQGKRELNRDAKFLYTIWNKIRKLADNSKAPTLLYKEYDLIWKAARDLLTEDVERLIIDSEEEYVKLRKFVRNVIGPHMLGKIQCYKGDVPIFEAKNVSKELSKIYDTRVFLKSGAYIIIEPTEGLIVVDVNSGKFKTKASPEDAAFMVNMEAAPEIARQLRLRDLGGIIVIDFIDMMQENHKRKVLTTLQNALEQDHAKTEVNKISSLGLVEMTRKRTGKAIETISFTPCPYCDGRGRVKIA